MGLETRVIPALPARPELVEHCYDYNGYRMYARDGQVFVSFHGRLTAARLVAIAVALGSFSQSLAIVTGEKIEEIEAHG